MNKVKRVSFTVYRPFFDQIKNGTKTIEFRKYNDHWIKLLLNPSPSIAVFVCGRYLVHRRKIRYVEKLSEKDFGLILGHKLSEEGRIDFEIDKYKFVFATHLGEVVEV